MGGNINLNQTTFAGVLSALVIDADKDFGGFNITNLGAGGHNLNTKLGYLDQDVKIAASPTFVGLTLSGLTQGSVLFAGAGGVISEDNPNLFWDNVHNWLGIGRNVPTCRLDIDAPVTSAGNIQFRVTDGATGGYFAVEEQTSIVGDYLPGFKFKGTRDDLAGILIGQTSGDTKNADYGIIQIRAYNGTGDAPSNANLFSIAKGITPVSTWRAGGRSDHQYGATFNEGGYDSDFRIEGVGEANALFVQGSDGNVGIGKDNPQAKFDIHGNSFIGDYSGGNYAEVKSDGEINLHGTGRVERHWLIDPARFRLPAANYPAESFEGLFYTLDFDKSTDESAYCEEHVPYRWDSSTDIEVEVWWLHDSVDVGVVVWGIEYLSIKEDETVGAAGTTITQASAGNHTAGELQKTTFTTKILHANLETHDAIAIRLFRDADNGSDTLAEDARVVNVCFHFIMNKLGQAT